MWISRFKGGVTADAVTCHHLFFVFRGFSMFFSFMRIITCAHVGPIIAVNDLNGAFWWLRIPISQLD